MTSNVIYQRFGPQPFTNPDPPKFYLCGGCDCYHPVNWDGDCRDDDNRFAPDELDEKYPDLPGPDGVLSGGWTEVLSPAIDFDEYIELVEQTHGITITDAERFRERYESSTPYECDPEFDDFPPGTYHKNTRENVGFA